jgi:cardiolipin synthase
MRAVRRLLLIVVLALIAVVLFAGYRILRFEQQPSIYPPPAGAVSANRAKEVAASVAAQSGVDRNQLAMDIAPSRAASVQLYVDGQSFYPPMLADIQAARSSIHLEEYGFTTGEVADQFAPALEQKARQGVEVRMIVDRFGSHVDTGGRSMFEGLAASGAQVAVNYPFVLSWRGLYAGDQWVDPRFEQLGHFYHRKFFVIDGQIAWVGGAGIEDYFYDGSFQDVFVRVTGDVVAQLQMVFLTDFRFHGGSLPSTLDAYFPTPSDDGSIPTTLVTTVPGEDHRAVTDAIWDLIENARGRLDIIDPYVADTGTLDRIIVAARRGVKVRFIVPASSNAPPVQWAFEHHLPDLQAAGVAVYLHPVLPHAKVVVADERVLVGSTNLDAWALFRNWETSLVFDNAQVATMFENQLLDPDVAASSPATLPTGLQRLRDSLAFLFTPLL